MRALLARLRRDESGESVIAAAIAFTVIITLLSAVFQAALWFAARNAAMTAAKQGVAVARDRGSTLAAGQAAACALAGTAGHGMLKGPSCTGSGGTTITITVTGRAVSFLPFFNPGVTETATGPTERWTVDTGGGS